MIEFKAPASVDEAQDRRLTLSGEINEIQAQLGDRTKRSTLSKPEYDAWRKAALWAWTSRLQELRRLKDWLRQHRGGGNMRQGEVSALARNSIMDWFPDLDEDVVEDCANEIARELLEARDTEVDHEHPQIETA